MSEGQFFLASVPWRVETPKIFEKIKKISKFQKCSKSLPKVSKRVLNMFGRNFFWGNFFDKVFLPSVPWRVETPKFFKEIKKFSKFQKFPKSFPKLCKCVLNMCWCVFFEFFYQCSMESLVYSFFLILTPNNGDSICRRIGKKLKLRRPALHVIILHSATKSAMIAPPNELTDSYTLLLPKGQPYLNSMSWTPKSKPYITTIPENNLS